MKPKNLFAIWRYDLYPYFLGAPISEMREDGKVQCDAYGKGFWFMPIKVLPRATGVSVLAEIKKLGVDRERELQTVKNAYDKRLAALGEKHGIEVLK